MSRSLFFLTRLIAIFFLVYITVVSEGITSRELMLFISTVVFLSISKLYENKIGFFSLSYIFYFMVCFLSFNIYAYLFIYNEHILTLDQNKVMIPGDHYNLYFIIFVFISLTILIYLLCLEKIRLKVTTIYPIIGISDQYRDKLILTLLLCLIIIQYVLNFKSAYLIGIPLWSLVLFRFFLSKKNICSRLNLILVMICIIYYIEDRFILIQIIFPIIIGMSIILDMKYKFVQLGKWKVLVLLIISLLAVSIYGVLSEIYKLNKDWGADYDLEYIISLMQNFNLLYDWISRQIYRVFQIWIHLSGNMIEYAEINGFLYGTSFINGLLDERSQVKLAELSAELIGASYAQPGAFGEGYINFGIIGAYANLIIMFFLIEFFVINFLKKVNLFSFILLITPFTKILLDGGTIISSLIIISSALILNLISIRRGYIK